MRLAIMKIMVVFFVCTLLGACGPAVKYYSANGVMKARTAEPLQEYRIQPGDQLDIKFFYNPELNEQIIVRPDGKISLQLVTELMARPAHGATEESIRGGAETAGSGCHRQNLQ